MNTLTQQRYQIINYINPMEPENYQNMNEAKPPQEQLSNKAIVGYICQLILCCLIVVYCALSQSLFSTIALIFLLAIIVLTITQPKRLIDQQEALIKNQKERLVQTYSFEKIIWSIFIALNFLILIFKIVAYYTLTDQLTGELIELLELQSLLYVFLPILLFPFAILSLMIEHKPILIIHFREKINKYLPTPLFLVLGILILLIQIFSISIAGILYFGIMIYIFATGTSNFRALHFRVVLMVIQSLTIVMIVLNYGVLSNYFKDINGNEYYAFFGINSLLTFLSSVTARGHIICEILLFLMAAFMNHLCVYQKIHLLYMRNCDDWSINQSVIFGNPEIKQIKKHSNELEEGEQADFTQRSIIKEYQREKRTNSLQPNKVRLDSLKQYQLPAIQLKQKQQSGDSIHRSASSRALQAHRTKPIFSKINIEPQKSPINDSDLESPQKKKKKKQPTTVQRCEKKFLQYFNSFLQFINSPTFSLRVTELISIIVIQRYNNIYSFGSLIWLAIVSSVENIRVILIVTGFFMLPFEITNFFITYLFNIPESPLVGVENAQIFGFQPLQNYWLDIIIFNAFFYYIILFIKAVIQIGGRKTLYSGNSHQNIKPNAWVLAAAFIFRYTYLLTIFAMFFLGFSTLTLVNMFYVILFLIFFSTGENLLLQKKKIKKNEKDKQRQGQKEGQRLNENERQKKKQNSQYRTTLTTFSKQYWFLIVYYTLLIIILKYIYFLFFPNQLSTSLDPTGINEAYNWAFNFSLSSIDSSNTTPFFIVFVLAELQIIVYRSQIYTHHSFNLLITADQRIKATRKKKLTFFEFIKKAVVLMNQLYYQGLYYISGIIILACSYKWSFFGLAIAVLTCWGLMKNFNKKILASIVFLDLAFLFLNYVVLFKYYPAIYESLGAAAINTITEIALFIGLTVDTQSYAEYFALNVVIFYFSVESYRLSNILEMKRYTNERDEGFDDEESKSRRVSLGKTIIDSEFQDKVLAENYQVGVINATQDYYNENLLKKYTWMRYMGRGFTMFFTAIVTFFVVISCLYFRVSVSMLLFLVIYMKFYYSLFQNIGELFIESEYYSKVESELRRFKNKQLLLENRQEFKNIIEEDQNINGLLNFVQKTYEHVLLMKYKWKEIIWVYSASLSVVCLVLTYASQFITAQFYTQYIQFQYTDLLKIVLFILGVSSESTNFGSYIYFYYVMVIINVIQKLVLKFIDTYKKTEAKLEGSLRSSSSQNQLHLTLVEDPRKLIDKYVTEQFIESVQIFEPLEVEVSNIEGDMQIEYNKREDLYEQANILIYFNYKHISIKISILYGFLSFMIRFYLWLMLINVYEKGNMFSFAYLITVLCFWFKKVQFSMVKDINKAAIIILVLQYIVLLFDLNQGVSPLDLPTSLNLSFLQYVLPNNSQWITFIAVSVDQTDNSSFLSAFVINSIIIFLTEIYFMAYQYLSKYLIELISHIYERYQHILQTLEKMPNEDSIYLNFDNFKHFSFRVMKFAYETVINNSYLLVSVLIFILLSGVHNYISVFLLLLSFTYIYLGIFTKFSENQKLFVYTRYYYRFYSFVLFLIIFISLIFKIPVVPSEIQVQAAQIGALTNLEEIFLLLFIQIWLDLSYSEPFHEVAEHYKENLSLREKIFLQCHAFEKNNYLYHCMIRSYKEVLNFEINISEAMRIIKEWHSIMNKDMRTLDYDIGQQKMNKNDGLIAQVKKELEAEHVIDDHKGLGDIFQGFIIANTDYAFTCKYSKMIRFIMQNTGRLSKIKQVKVDLWDYVLEDYAVLDVILKNYQNQFNKVAKRIVESEVKFDDLIEIREEIDIENEENIEEEIVKIKTPKKIQLNFHEEETNMAIHMLSFLLSNFEYFILFLVWIYYILNPCLVSAPLIIFYFSYSLIATNKMTNLVVFYIFIIILFAEITQLELYSTTSSNLISYFFFQDEDSTYQFDLGYLYFLFVMLFLHQEINKYKGTKFHNQTEVQNLEKAGLRILINQPENSPRFLWRFRNDQDIEVETINPFTILRKDVEAQESDRFMTSESSFVDIFTDKKQGIDIYPLIATVQIFLTIFLIFFYPLVAEPNGAAIEQTTKYFQFSSQMVIAVLVHVVVIVIERRITLLVYRDGIKELIKYVWTMFIFAWFLVFIYYIAPFDPPSIYQPTSALIAFSTFYFLYFIFSAIQIKHGYKKFKNLNSMLTRRGYANDIVASVYTAIPFLYEVKIIMDWTFTQTAMSLIDWFRLFAIYVAAFKAKINYLTATTQVTLGKTLVWYYKIIGLAGFIIILLIIFGPMILFSGLNPAAESNLVVGGSMAISIQIIGGNSFTLYQTSHFSSPPISFNQSLFDLYQFENVPLLQGLSSSDIQEQFQSVTYEPFSDSNWGISQPNYNNLVTLLNQTIIQMNNSQSPTNQFQMVADYILNRRVTSITASETNFLYPNNGSALNQAFLEDILQTLTQCNQTTQFPNFYNSLISLITSGSTYKPRPINYTDSNGNSPYVETVNLTMYCQQVGQAPPDTNEIYWGFTDVNNTQISSGVTLFVFCDKYQSLLGGLGFTALYTSIILVIAGFVRTMFDGNLPMAQFYLNPKSDNILQICEAIGTLRVRKQFREEYLVYYELIDIIRSPEIMKYMSGSYPYHIQKAYEVEIQKKKIEEEKKNL